MKLFYSLCLIICSLLVQAQDVTLFEFTGEVLTPMETFPNATTSDFQVTGTTPTFNSAQADTWSGSGVPVAQSGSDWDADDPDDAKYFFFTIDADEDFEMNADQLSFQWRATGNGPSAITVEINGIEIETFDTPENETTDFTADLTSFENLTEIEVRIKGWDNGSRVTPGTGILRVNDVRLEGEIFATNPVLIASPDEVLDLDYIEGNGPSAPQAVAISGENLDGTDVDVNLPSDSDFEMADSESGTYGESLTLADFDGSSIDIFVRLKEGLSENNYTDEITISGGDADDLIIPVSGEVGEAIFLIYEFTGEVLTPAQSPSNATTSDFQVTGTTPTFNNTASHDWTGSGVPVAQSGSDWGEDNPDDAKYFFFTIDAATGFEMNLNNISFEWRATANGPSAITVEINGNEVETFDAAENETTIFSAPLTEFDDLSEIEVRIKGWDNGSRTTPGSGILRVNDVRLDGEIFSTTSVIVVNPTQVDDLNYIEGNGPSMAQEVNVSGIDLDGSDVFLDLPSDSAFEIANAQDGTYSESLTLTEFDGSETSVFVRLKEGLDVDLYTDELTLTGGGSDPIQVSVSGEVGEEVFLIYEFTDETALPTQFPDNAIASNFEVSMDEPLGFGNAQPETWTAGSGVPYATSQENWGATEVDDAKYFSFVLAANDGFQINADQISFEWRATGNGPSAITVEINGTEIETFDAEENTTSVFSAEIPNTQGVSQIEIRIKGWDNGSRTTTGGGFFRINDVRLDGEVEPSMSTEDFDQNSNISIYPNPSTNGNFTVQNQRLNSQGEVQLSIYNINGQQVYSRKHTASNEIQVNANNLSKGIYMVVVAQNNKKFTKKLIIE